MPLDSVVYLCVLIIWLTAGQMPAVVAADKEWDFFVCVCLFLTIVYLVFLFVLPLSRERLDID